MQKTEGDGCKETKSRDTTIETEQEHTIEKTEEE